MKERKQKFYLKKVELERKEAKIKKITVKLERKEAKIKTDACCETNSKWFILSLLSVCGQRGQLVNHAPQMNHSVVNEKKQC